jgi:hypothetical protein
MIFGIENLACVKLLEGAVLQPKSGTGSRKQMPPHSPQQEAGGGLAFLMSAGAAFPARFNSKATFRE